MHTIRRCVDRADQGPITSAYKAKGNWIDLSYRDSMPTSNYYNAKIWTLAGETSLLSLMDGEIGQ